MRVVSLLAAVAVALAAAPSAVAWTWPADGPVLRAFALGDDVYGAGQHRGIDVAGATGAPVRAPAGGRVSYAGTLPHYGRTLTIRTDDGYAVTLLHLGELAVAKNATVAAGQVVAAVGPSGELEQDVPYLHLGVRLADDEHGYVDPLTLLPARAPPAAPAVPVAVPGASPPAVVLPAGSPGPAAAAAATSELPEAAPAPVPAKAAAPDSAPAPQPADVILEAGASASPAELPPPSPRAAATPAATVAVVRAAGRVSSRHPRPGGRPTTVAAVAGGRHPGRAARNRHTVRTLSRVAEPMSPRRTAPAIRESPPGHRPARPAMRRVRGPRAPLSTVVAVAPARARPVARGTPPGRPAGVPAGPAWLLGAALLTLLAGVVVSARRRMSPPHARTAQLPAPRRCPLGRRAAWPTPCARRAFARAPVACRRSHGRMPVRTPTPPRRARAVAA